MSDEQLWGGVKWPQDKLENMRNKGGAIANAFVSIAILAGAAFFGRGQNKMTEQNTGTHAPAPDNKNQIIMNPSLQEVPGSFKPAKTDAEKNRILKNILSGAEKRIKNDNKLER